MSPEKIKRKVKRKKKKPTGSRGSAVRRIAGKAPFDIESALTKAIHFQKTGRVQMAEKIYRNILIHDPDHAHSLSMLGIIAFKAGEKEKAAALIKQAIRKDPKNPSLYFNLGNVLQGLDKDSQAISCYKKALQINPKDNNSDILNNLANSLTAVGRYDEALVCYQKTLHTSTHKAELLNNIAKAHHELKVRSYFGEDYGDP